MRNKYNGQGSTTHFFLSSSLLRLLSRLLLDDPSSLSGLLLLLLRRLRLSSESWSSRFEDLLSRSVDLSRRLRSSLAWGDADRERCLGILLLQTISSSRTYDERLTSGCSPQGGSGGVERAIEAPRPAETLRRHNN